MGKDILSKISNQISKSDYISFIIGFIFCIINNFCMFAYGATAPDALCASEIYISGDWELELGRWGIHFIDKFRGGLVNSFLIILVSAFLIGLSCAMINRIFKAKKKITIVLISILIAVCPQFSETLMFTYCADSYILSFFLAILSIYILTKEDKIKNYIISIPLIVFAVSLYQAYIGVVLGLLIISELIYCLRNKITKKDIIYFFKKILTIGLALIIYFIVTKIYLKCNGLDLASYKGADSFGFISIITSLPSTIINVYRDFFNYYFGETIIYNRYWHRHILNLIIGLITLVSFILLFIKSKKKGVRLSSIIYMVIILIIMPILINMLDIIMPSTSINLVTGVALILPYLVPILIICEEDIKIKTRIFIYVVIILILLLCHTFIYSNNASFMARKDVRNNYYTISSDILSRAKELDGYNEDLKWFFNDYIIYRSKYMPISNGFVSLNYETWDNPYGTWLNIQFYDRYLGQKIQMVTYDEYNEIIKSEEFSNMPIYPAKGSIKIVNDYIIVKLSDVVHNIEQ